LKGFFYLFLFDFFFPACTGSALATFISWLGPQRARLYKDALLWTWSGKLRQKVWSKVQMDSGGKNIQRRRPRPRRVV
jgi:hypothetical protein